MVAHVGFRPEWRGEANTVRRPAGLALLLALVAHLPLTPLGALAGLVALLAQTEMAAAPPPPQLNEIPIDFMPDDRGARAAPAAAPAPAPTAQERDEPDQDDEPSAPAPRVGGRRRDLARDAGADAPDDAAPAPSASAAASAAPSASPAPSAPPGPASSSSPAGLGAGSPVALAGSAGRIADGNANVQVVIHSRVLRKHPLADRVGSALSLAYQWREFFGPTGLDPIRDVDQLLLAGPQFRVSDEVVAVLRYNVQEERMHRAIDALVTSDPEHGRWVDERVARVAADRAERVVALASPGIAVVAPVALEAKVRALPRDLRFSAGGPHEALSASVVTPSRALVGLPFKLSDSISRVDLRIDLTESGGATVTLRGVDSDAEAAARDARSVQDQLRALTEIKGVLAVLTGGRRQLLDEISFHAEGNLVLGTVTASAEQLRYLVGLIANIAREVADENARKARAAASAKAAASQAPAGKPAPSSSGPSAVPSPSSPRQAPPAPSNSAR